MEHQTIINLLGGLVCVLVGWYMHRVWEEMKALRQTGDRHSEIIQQLQLLVAGEYVKRAEFDQHILRVFDKLDAISSKLDKKADR
ncbi:hypothetical protein [Parahaliea mediterranea]|uniref:hypothetical protein n=1 Tax=Parahaliea mediterranea TaxID=651086 RepID=UPI000E2FEFE8|nr:hypothetical protein [Parahaliea mediterranea]